jgi:phage tail sheath protein FI
VNVRRLFNFVEKSVDRGLQWLVFEPNADPTWAKVRRTIETFLESVWRSGALMGTTKDEAFFVRCDRTTMSTDDILNGRLICLIGLAAVRPAEFVVLRFSQFTAEATQ